MWKPAIRLYGHSRLSLTNQSLLVPRACRHVTPLRLTTIRRHGSHSHSDGHVHADLTATLKNSGKKGVRITVIGLFANVGLTLSKGIAGWMMNSASLLADAAHSCSDLISDFVTLYTFKMSRKPPDSIYPYGYGKYETVGTLAVSTLLITGGIGIGWHSFDLLLTVFEATNATTGTAASTVAAATESSALTHHHSSVLDPNAAWFALASVLIKEWLYRATIKIGHSERSDVLIANAWHHRSDALSSLVALAAIGGSYAGMPVLDPLGGIVVSGMILKSGADIMTSSLQELTDKGIGGADMEMILSVIDNIKDEEADLVDFHSIRGRKVGPFHHVDLILQLKPNVTVEGAHRIEQLVRSTVKHECKLVQEVLIHLDAEKQPPHH